MNLTFCLPVARDQEIALACVINNSSNFQATKAGANSLPLQHLILVIKHGYDRLRLAGSAGFWEKES